MKILGGVPRIGNEGSVGLVPEEPEDMWACYNVIAPGDHITATTFRKVVKESAGGTSSSEKKKIRVTLEVVSLDFDPVSSEIRVKGKNIAESDYLKLGAFHTLELSLNRNFSLFKHCWDSLYSQTVKNAANPSSRAEVAVVLIQQGLAHIVLLTDYLTISVAKIEGNLPKKRAVAAGASLVKAMNKFFSQIIEGMKRHLKMDVLKCVVIGSPGFIKDEFMKFLLAEAVEKGDRTFLDHKSKFLLVHADSAHLHSVKTLLQDPAVKVQVADTKAARDSAELQRFFETLNDNPDKAYYGYDHIVLANKANAIEVLMVSDDLFRSIDPATRKKYVSLVESVKSNGADVLVFSSLHASGEQLSKMSGVAAILRFPMPELDDVEIGIIAPAGGSIPSEASRDYPDDEKDE